MDATRQRRERQLDWDGCFNVRDLGGMRAAGGRETRWGAVVRADSVDGLTAAGWAAVAAHGVRTVIDLRNADERGPDAASRPSTLTTLHLPLDGTEDREFWDVWQSGPQFGTPLYYRPHLERFPQRSAAVLKAIVRAQPGGVVFHCGGGRDRAGQIAMLVLAVVGLSAEDIAADYALSAEGVRRRCEARGEPDQQRLLDEFLAARRTSAGDLIVQTLAGFDVASQLGPAGLTDQDVTALRRRLLGP